MINAATLLGSALFFSGPQSADCTRPAPPQKHRKGNLFTFGQYCQIDLWP